MAAPGGAAVVRHQDGVRPRDHIARTQRDAGDLIERRRGPAQRIGLWPPGPAAIGGGPARRRRPHRLPPLRAQPGPALPTRPPAAALRLPPASAPPWPV